MVLATSPFRIHSAILKTHSSVRVPAVGGSPGLDTAVFELWGSANKPQLRYLAAEPLMTGVKGTAQLASIFWSTPSPVNPFDCGGRDDREEEEDARLVAIRHGAGSARISRSFHAPHLFTCRASSAARLAAFVCCTACW